MFECQVECTVKRCIEERQNTERHTHTLFSNTAMYRLVKAGITHTHTHTHLRNLQIEGKLRSEVSRAQEVDEAGKLPLGRVCVCVCVCVCVSVRAWVRVGVHVCVSDPFTAPPPSCLSHQGVPPGTLAIGPEAEDSFSKGNLTT